MELRGGTGMSPWPMMNEWGIPTFYLQSLWYEFACKLDKKGYHVTNLAMAGSIRNKRVGLKHSPWEVPISRPDRVICVPRVGWMTSSQRKKPTFGGVDLSNLK